MARPVGESVSGRASGGGPPGQSREVAPGEYQVTLQVGDRKLTQMARVLK